MNMVGVKYMMDIQNQVENNREAHYLETIGKFKPNPKSII